MMSQSAMPALARPSDREVIFSRVLDAPRNLVWKVWTHPRHLHEWFGPEGFTATTYEFAFEVGGVWRFTMHGPDGTDYPTVIVFREIDAPSRIVYDNGWDLPGAPLDFTVDVTFDADGDKTRFSLRITCENAAAMKTAVERYGVLDGGVQTLTRLAEYVATLG
jgi:uncharacterized protein YndB with AHSA1/START domain